MVELPALRLSRCECEIEASAGLVGMGDMATDVARTVFLAEAGLYGFDRAGIERQHLRPHGGGFGHIRPTPVVHDVIAKIGDVELVLRPRSADARSQGKAAMSLQYSDRAATSSRDRL